MALGIGTEAPDFTLMNTEGDHISLSQFRGTPVYLLLPCRVLAGVRRLVQWHRR